MPLNLKKLIPSGAQGGGRDPRAGWKIVLGTLLALNLLAAGMVMFPPGGSAEQLDRDLVSLRGQMHARQTELQKLRALVKKVETARSEQESFMQEHFIDRASSSSTIIGEIDGMATKAGLQDKGNSYDLEPIEGSDSISMLTVTTNYEGSYKAIVEFVNLVDRSDRFLIIDNISAAPLQTAGVLSVRVKMNTFVREGVPAAPRQISSSAEAAR